MTPLLHPGYHKTGTSWMQKRLFLPAHGYAPVLGHEDVDELIFQPGPFAFDAGRVRARAEERHAQMGPALVPVISSEILSGQPYTGGRDCRMMADRLREAFPDARVMLSIREQLALLASLYMQYLQAGGTAPCARFFSGREVINNHGFDPAFHEFDGLVGHYRDLFGADRVIVHPMEVLVSDPPAIVAALNALTGAGTDPAGVDFSNATFGARESVVPVIRRINHFRRNDFGHEPVADLGGAAWFAYRAVNKLSRSTVARRIGLNGKPVTRYVRERFAGRFAASNRRLQAMTGHDLAALGYEMAAPAPAP